MNVDDVFGAVYFAIITGDAMFAIFNLGQPIFYPDIGDRRVGISQLHVDNISRADSVTFTAASAIFHINGFDHFASLSKQHRSDAVSYHRHARFNLT
jgi:hypothetical protein